MNSEHFRKSEMAKNPTEWFKFSKLEDGYSVDGFVENFEERFGTKPTELYLPDKYMDSFITEIGEKAFYQNQLTSVVIPNSVKTISRLSFEENRLISIEIPNSVIFVGNQSFYNNNLTSVKISNSLVSIGRYAFANNQITSFEIPNTVEFIGESAFSYNQLTSIVIPNSVRSIGIYAFSDNQLESVVISNSIDSIGESTFWYNQLTSVEIPNSVKIIGNEAFSYNKLVSVILPDSVEYIESYAFRENQINSLELPNSVKVIGDGAFASNDLTSLIIPDSVISIGEYAFYNNKLESVMIPDSILGIGEKAFENKNGASAKMYDSETKSDIEESSNTAYSGSNFQNENYTSISDIHQKENNSYMDIIPKYIKDDPIKYSEERYKKFINYLHLNTEIINNVPVESVMKIALVYSEKEMSALEDIIDMETFIETLIKAEIDNISGDKHETQDYWSGTDNRMSNLSEAISLYGIEPDYTMESLLLVGGYLADKDFEDMSNKSKDQLWQVSTAYYGEVIRRNSNSRWRWLSFEDASSEGTIIEDRSPFNSYVMADSSNNVTHPLGTTHNVATGYEESDKLYDLAFFLSSNNNF